MYNVFKMGNICRPLRDFGFFGLYVFYRYLIHKGIRRGCYPGELSRNYLGVTLELSWSYLGVILVVIVMVKKQYSSPQSGTGLHFVPFRMTKQSMSLILTPNQMDKLFVN